MCHPIIYVFLNFENKIGLPGLIATLLKKLASLNFLIIPGTKSNLPAETAPDVIIIFVLDFKCLFMETYVPVKAGLYQSIENGERFDKTLTSEEGWFCAKFEKR